MAPLRRLARGVPLLLPFYADNPSPAYGAGSALLLTDGPWAEVTKAPAIAGR